MSISIGESVCPPWYADGSDTPVYLNGGATLEASTTYRTFVSTADAEWVTFQWQQQTGGTGTIAAQEVRRTLENGTPAILELGNGAIWTLTALVFATLPAGAEDSDILDVVDAAGTYFQVEFTTDAAPVTGLRFLAQVRR